MSLLELQGLAIEQGSAHRGPPLGSRASKGCLVVGGGGSRFSLLFC
ncbi:SapB/AmfS family lanthipeptide [Streptomyces sp. NBC_00487]|nr:MULTISPECIES: SapB/AmfS family lanthipeptide [unclassified Streptomyces]WRY98947.1 SapB/AmfS family lanthipeptide [Streptomyces sp. NBC_00481]